VVSVCQSLHYLILIGTAACGRAVFADDTCGDGAPVPSQLAGTIPAQVPPDFIDEPFAPGWDFAVGLDHLPDGRLVVFEREGRIWLVDADGNRAHDPLIDLSHEVESSIDRGLMDVAVDPDFERNGFIYLLYQVDWHFHENGDDPDFNPILSDHNRPTFSRITRYTVTQAMGYDAAEPSSRTILVGTDPLDGFPVVAPFHGVGSLFFGEDGSLLATCGDAASFNTSDMGGDVVGSYAVDALAEGTIRPNENVGSWRAQMIDSLAGKVIRIDPATGNGVISNPFFDKTAPRAARSRVWALGFRMPFRAALQPGSGAGTMDAGDPGTIVLGDVGNSEFEELNIVPEGGLNCGWPMFEGLDATPIFANANTPNLDLPNPDFDGTSCTQSHFYFRDLLTQDAEDTSTDFPMPCDPGTQIPSDIPHFVHHRPVVEIGHFGFPTRVPTMTAGEADAIAIDDPGSPVMGGSFNGSSCLGGAFCPPISFPESYHGKFFFMDYAWSWVRTAEFDAANTLVAVESFAGNLKSPVAMDFNPVDGSLYYISYTDEVRRIRYIGGNQPPVVFASADTMYGPGPLDVQFDATSSRDPEDGSLAFEWDFGDGTPISNEAAPLHTFTASPGVPTSYDVTLTVTDPGGESVTRNFLISVNNSPPEVTVTSLVDGELYSMIDGMVTLALEADIVDAEHGPGELTCSWQTILHHNDHNHPGLPDPTCMTSTTFEPFGCEEDATYWYVIRLKVTDDAGLSTTVDTALFPDCSFIPDCPGDIVPQHDDGTVGNGVINIDDLFAVINALGSTCGSCPADVIPIGIGNGVVNIDDLLLVLNEFGPCPDES